MKNDPFFKLTAVVILAGVIAAFASPGPKPAAQTPATPASAQTVSTTPLALAAPQNLPPVATPDAGRNRASVPAVGKS